MLRAISLLYCRTAALRTASAMPLLLGQSRPTIGRILAYQESGTSPLGQLRDMASIKARMDAANEALKCSSMMCYQCEQTKNNTGCTEIGKLI